MVVITYDIEDDKRLRKVAKILEENGIRTQRSVFEVERKIANKVFKEIKEILEGNDKCFFIPVIDKEDIVGDTSIERIFWCIW